MRIHFDAALFDNTFGPYAGQEGTVLEDHGSSYTVVFADTAIIKMPHEVVKLAAKAKALQPRVPTSKV